MGEGIVGMWSEERGERLTVRVFSLHAEDGERLTDFSVNFERLRESA